MATDDTRRFVLWTARRTLGISSALFVFYLLAPRLWEIPPLDPRAVVSILGVVLVGVLFGVTISFYWPLPAETGLPRAIRSAIVGLPAFGFGLAVHVTLAGAEANRAYWIMFALAALLGSTYRTAEPRSDPSEVDDREDGSGERSRVDGRADDLDASPGAGEDTAVDA